jgi:hypothetical protein
MPEERARLPEANEFSPGQISLSHVLAVISSNEGNRPLIVETLRSKYFSNSALDHPEEATRLRIQRTRATNVLIGMKAYGLLDSITTSLTPVGNALLKETDPVKQHVSFAKHILLEKNGLRVLQVVRQLQSRNEPVTKTTLHQELERCGFSLPRATTHHTKLLQWLREARIIDDKNRINDDALKRATGVAGSALGELSGLTAEQIAFIRTLKRLSDKGAGTSYPAKDLIDLCVLEHGKIFKEDQLRSSVFLPLERKGWLTLEARGSGRGGKSGTLSPTSKLTTMNPSVLLGLAPNSGLPAEVMEKLNKPLASIYADLASQDTYTKGIALELLAIRMASDLGLTPLRFRERSNETGGAEVDLIAQAAQLHFSRWLFQCKNTRSVRVSDLAKEVGMAYLLKAHIIVIATTGNVSKALEKFATELSQSSPLQVVLLDGEALAQYQAGGRTFLLQHLRAISAVTEKHKFAQIAGALPKDEGA